jgi:hypothetical protein
MVSMVSVEAQVDVEAAAMEGIVQLLLMRLASRAHPGPGESGTDAIVDACATIRIVTSEGVTRGCAVCHVHASACSAGMGGGVGVERPRRLGRRHDQRCCTSKNQGEPRSHSSPRPTSRVAERPERRDGGYHPE